MGKLTALLIGAKKPADESEHAEHEAALADAVAQMRCAKTDREAAMWFRAAFDACEAMPHEEYGEEEESEE